MSIVTRFDWVISGRLAWLATWGVTVALGCTEAEGTGTLVLSNATDAHGTDGHVTDGHVTDGGVALEVGAPKDGSASDAGAIVPDVVSVDVPTPPLDVTTDSVVAPDVAADADPADASAADVPLDLALADLAGDDLAGDDLAADDLAADDLATDDVAADDVAADDLAADTEPPSDVQDDDVAVDVGAPDTGPTCAPSPDGEQCNGKDDDCDDEIDEGFTWLDPATNQGLAVGAACDADGACGVGVVECATLTSARCSTGIDGTATQVKVEACNGQDDDCDGFTDEVFVSLGSPCTRGVGPCAQDGKLVCDVAQSGTQCSVSGVAAGVACDDGVACTKADQCMGGDASSCAGTAYSCADDGKPCTQESCVGDGTCVAPLASGHCLIAGQCVVDGAESPVSPCQVCVAATSTTDWTFRTVGTGCDDGASCTKDDACDAAGQCKGQGLDCDDGLACTVDECDGAVCVSPKPLKPATCLIEGVCLGAGQPNPKNPCEACAPAIATTAWTPVTGPVACDDGNVCTTKDICAQGKCEGSDLNACDDDNGCTVDSCDPGSGTPAGCVHTASVGATCDDLSACTANDACDDAGKCTGKALTPADCDDQNECTVDACPDAKGCTHAHAVNGAPCSADALECTVDQCVNGTCDHASLAPSWCLIASACVASGSADPGNTCRACLPEVLKTGYAPRPPGFECDADGTGCTVADHCDGKGACAAGVAADCSAKTDACNVGTCAPDGAAAFGCDAAPVVDGKPCPDDGNPCRGDVCSAGKCAHPALSPTTVCTFDENRCTEDHCDGNGTCIGAPLPENTPCDADALACTAESCDLSATCVPAVTTGCLVGNACVAAGATEPGNPCRSCQPTKSTVAWSAKDDGLDCGTCAACSAGACVADLTQHGDCTSCRKCVAKDQCGVQASSEDLKNECSPSPGCGTGQCNGSGACAFAALNTTCSDENACTLNDKCNTLGSCIPGAAKVCNAPATCHVSSGATCNPTDGVCTYPNAQNGASCSDNNACTSPDKCTDGACTPGAAVTCNDNSNCTVDTCETATGCVFTSNGTCKTWTLDTKPIFVKYCTSCHNAPGSGGFGGATSYTSIPLASGHCAGKKKGECTLVRINEGSMPPGVNCASNFNGTTCPTAAERATLQSWIDTGMTK